MPRSTVDLGPDENTRFASDPPQDPNQDAATLYSHAAPQAAPADRPAAGRYVDLGSLGKGGVGEVRRVLDTVLGRVVARKVLREDRCGDPGFAARFAAEAQLVAQLQHPGVVPLYDYGVDEDGRAWFTMREVRGQTLGLAISAVHLASRAGRWEATPDGLSLHRLIDAFADICHAVAYAHARGVLHRDLKPANAMLGEHGEVLVLDWGLGKAVPGAGTLDPITLDARDTIAGGVMGTPGYMPPEQAAGRPLDARADIYALGAVLYEILYGRAPYRGPAREVLAAVRAGRAPRFQGDGPPPPAPLVALCRAALASDPAARPSSAEALARAARDWLEGVGRREEALALVAQAARRAEEAAKHAAEAEALASQAAAALQGVPGWAPEDQKAPAWALEDRAAVHRARALDLDLRAGQDLHLALQRAPDLVEAHEALLVRARAALAAAEGRSDATEVQRATLAIQEHVDHLPVRARGPHLDALRGDGALTLHTDPPGAEVLLERYTPYGRRLIAEPVGPLGRTPLDAVPLPMGSYRLRVRAPGYAELLYPVRVGRGAHWDGVPPGASEPHPIPLLRDGEIGPGEVYIPAGWTTCGGDPDARADAATRIWVEGFLLDRHAQTWTDYIAFLNDLVAQGRHEETIPLVPRAHANLATPPGEPMLTQTSHGTWRLADIKNPIWPNTPVLCVDLSCALAMARWRSARDGGAWGLPEDFAWEKAGRGVDARFYPWGSWRDPSWSCSSDSHAGIPRRSKAEEYPVDESPYGVRHMAGSVRCWTATPFPGSLPRAEHLWTPIGLPEPRGELSLTRGGAWYGLTRYCRLANREPDWIHLRDGSTGIRLGRSLPR